MMEYIKKKKVFMPKKDRIIRTSKWVFISKNNIFLKLKRILKFMFVKRILKYYFY